MRRGKRPLACSTPTDNETDTTAAPHVFGPLRTPPLEQRTSHGQLDGALKRFEHVAWKDWPPWARAHFGRLHKPLRGVAALTERSERPQKTVPHLLGRQRVVWRYMLPDVEQPVNFKPRSPLTAHQALGHPWPDIILKTL